MKTILIVDDESLIAVATEAILERRGFAAETVSTGEHAISFMAQHPGTVDLVLMDVDLGKGMDGTDAAREILRHHDVPIVFYSSHTEEQVVNRTESIPFYGYVPKEAGEIVLMASIGMAFRLFEARKSARMSEVRFAALTGNLRLGFAHCRMIFEDDRPVDFVYLNINPAFERLTGLNNVTGKRVTEIIPGIREAVPELFEVYGRVARTGVPEQYELLFSPLKIWLSIDVSSPAPEEFVAIFDDVTERHQATEEHLRLLERFNLALRSVRLGIWDWDIAANKMFWDDRMCELYGIQHTRETINYDTWKRSLLPADVLRAEDDSRMALRGEKEYDTEFRIRRADGSIRTLRANGVVIRNADGKPERMTGINIDITEQKESEEILLQVETRLRENNELLRSILESPRGLIIFSLDPDYRYRAFTVSHREAMRNIWGVEIAIGMNMLEAISDPADREKAKRNFDRTLQGEHLTFLEEYGDAGLYRTWWENKYSPMFDDGHHVVGLTVFVSDVTERRRTEDILSASEASYRGLFNTIDDAIYIQDVDGKFIDVNEGAVAMYGYPREYFIGRDPGFLAAPGKNDMPATLEAVHLAFAGSPQRMEWWGLRKNGEIFPKDIRIKRGSYFGRDVIITVARDITEQKRIEEDLQRLLRQQDVLMRELQHRVKNNLNIIASLLSLEVPRLTDEHSRAVFTDAQGRIRSMVMLYEQLYRSTDLVNVNVRAYFENLAQTLFKTYVTDSARIHLTTSIADIKADLRWTVPLGLILNELMTNALKYAYPAPATGNLRVSLEACPEGITLSVEDQGVGMPAELDLKTASSMGLRLVRMLTEQMEGTFSVRSNGGTRVSIMVPR